MEKTLAQLKEFWNGKEHAYIPFKPLNISPNVKLHKEYEEEIDPITLEVIRHSLWGINQEHGKVIENLAVSPITLETRDFQTSLHTEEGDIILFGPYLQYFSGAMDLMIQYVLEHRGEKGINEGDMFLQNDPWIGAPHQPDVGICAPVVWEGKVFCWVSNVMHQNDIGGIMPGSFCQNAPDVFSDPPSFPPMKIVKEGKIDPELEAIYLRASRTPNNLALDLRAAIAGCHASQARILEMLKKYGPEKVKGAMRKMMNASKSAFMDFMKSIPDGTWSERVYQEVALTGDRGVYKVELSVTKKGDKLIFKNEGTDPQVGAINAPFCGWRGTILSALNVILLPDQMGAIGGAIPHLQFDPTPGTLTCPDYGAAVSPAGIYSNELAISMANSVISKMIMSSVDPKVRKMALSPTPAQWHINIHYGINQRGDYYVGPMLEHMIGTTGATLNRDGSFANGLWWVPEGKGPNIEACERDWPILYLYRNEHQDSAGSGRFRGGNGGILAYIPYKGQVTLGTHSSEGIPKTVGLQGGLPGSRGETRIIKNSNISRLFSEGKMPASTEEIQGQEMLTNGKGMPIDLSETDIVEWNWGSSPGYGDELDRDPELVRIDVENRIISQEAAEQTYGVKFTSTGYIDEQATKNKRLEMRKSRFKQCQKSAPHNLEDLLSKNVDIPKDAIQVGDYMFVNKNGSEAINVNCSCCGGVISTGTQDFKASCLIYKGTIQEAGKHFVDVERYIDQAMSFYQYFCPNCGTRIATEVKRTEDEHSIEFEIQL
ncbi:hydantoinase B/oxoprolinase family protein [Bacillus sp. V5-8f]|uniref:hydantoinase B/oxoprolinase family protein n=1 Tax=Bacillus sp. V5-8f TaxID=2053044 RepID=UPI000C75BAC4|nr:hydantoinase B/oxoprolinase family protein [Bacillus sp. V5-8f]PLT32096.1 hypothetical protein CUU64_21260 [Bacillus sp. V5-8f]